MGKQTGTKVVLVRCGRTDWDDANRLQGGTDLPLSESGRSELVAALNDVFTDGRCAAPVAIYCGPDEASRQSAQIIGERFDCRAKTEAGLAGMNLGLWEGLLEEELEERFPTCIRQWRDDPAPVTPPEGEPFGEMAARVADAVARLVGRSRGKPMAIVLRPIEYAFARCMLSRRGTNAMWSMLEDGPAVECHDVMPDAVRELADELRGATRA